MRELQPIQIGNLSIDPPIVLAPLAGFTDSAFRRTVRQFSAGLVYTEMISAMGIFYGDKKTLGLLNYKESEHAIAGQIFGSDPEKLAYASQVIQDKGFDVIDINFGCPTPKILKSNSGGALLKNFPLFRNILKSVRKAVKIPLTIKVRKGFRESENVLKELISIAEDEGVNAITIHGITVEEGFNKNAEDWESICRAKQIARIPIIGNGGVQTEEDVKTMFDFTGVDGVMVGRSVLSRPWFIKSCQNYIERGTTFSLSINEKLNIIIRQIEMEIEEKGEQIGVKEMRKFVQGYAYGMKGATRFRDKLNYTETSDELIALIRGFFVAKEEI
jgi:tRNA-dihydrouridine synthase B